MNVSFAAAMLAGFIALLVLANVGKSILTNWATPVSATAPATMATPLSPSPEGGLEPPPAVSIPAVHGVTTRVVTMPGSGKPIAVMPVPANPPSPPPLGTPGQPTGGSYGTPPNSQPRGDELPPPPRSY
jgi:hypothetical protein